MLVPLSGAMRTLLRWHSGNRAIMLLPLSGAMVPALRAFETPASATVNLYHVGMCRYPEWTDNDGTPGDSLMGVFKVIGPSEPALTWTAPAAHTPYVTLGDRRPVLLLVNAGVESVELARGEDGQCGSRRPPCISAMGCRLPVMRSTPSPVLRPWFGDS